MEEYNFIWGGVPIVSIASYGITFNTSAIELLGNPKRIDIGFDPDKKVLGVKPIYEKDIKYENAPEDREGVNFANRQKKGRRGYVRIGDKDLIRYISVKLEKDFSKAVKFGADWDKERSLLVVDLTKPLEGYNDKKDDNFNKK